MVSDSLMKCIFSQLVSKELLIIANDIINTVNTLITISVTSLKTNYKNDMI